MRIQFLLAFLIFPSCLFALEFGNRQNPVQMALGMTGTIPHLINNYVPDNPALATLCQSSCIQIAYHNSFFLPSLGRSQIGFVYSGSIGSFCSSVDYYGFTQYGEISASIAYARWFKPYVSVGLSVDYVGVYVADEKQMLHSGLVQIGLAIFPTKALSIGVRVYNLSFSPLKSAWQNIPLPTRFEIGIGYHFEKKASLCLNVCKELRSPIRIGFGLEYSPIKQVILRAGIAIYSFVIPTFGLGIRLEKFGCDVGFNYDVRLGLCAAAGIYYAW